MEVKICNSSAHEVDDVIVPPQMREAIPPLRVPSYHQSSLMALTPGQLMTESLMAQRLEPLLTCVQCILNGSVPIGPLTYP